MKRILITAGPVHAYLDDVKIISNIFRGGLMADFANQFSREYDVDIVYLCSEFTKMPKQKHNLKIEKHKGFYDYINKIKDISPDMYAVILGAAVANLIPWEPVKGKFPSHNYKEGQPIPILFKIAPRVINMIKNNDRPGFAPKTHLFGFKLLSNVDHEELINAAYRVLRDSKSTAIFANDKKDPSRICAVTKERGEHILDRCQLCHWIWEMINDEYYHTEQVRGNLPYKKEIDNFFKYLNVCRYDFTEVDNNLFGCYAYRSKTGGFLTTIRHKKDLSQFTHVVSVNHEKRIVYVSGMRATLNAPLLDVIFRNSEIESIIHYHHQIEGLPTLPYAPPGTVRDSIREIKQSFNVESHGCYLLNGGRCVA